MDEHSRIILQSGNAMPVLGLGTWQLTGKRVRQAVEYALGVGYRLIDTSGDYGNQSEIGEAIRHSGVNREELFITTKVEETDDAYEATRDNLEELGLDYADLVLIHRPPPDNAGEALWNGLIHARNDGLVMDIGVSNYSVGLIEDLIEATGEMPAANQIEWTPFGYSEEMYSYCNDNGIIIQAYSPITRQKRLGEPMLVEIARKYKKTPAQVILRWNLQHDVVPLPKAADDQHLKENIDVFDFELSDEDMTILDSLNEHYSSFSELSYIRRFIL